MAQRQLELERQRGRPEQMELELERRRRGRPPAAAPSPEPARAFSTRFLPSDGIPAYNALLDSHLGKRREFLLGNRKSLELLQQTGVVARVQASDANPNQYFVYMSEKPIHRRKRLPPPPHAVGTRKSDDDDDDASEERGDVATPMAAAAAVGQRRSVLASASSGDLNPASDRLVRSTRLGRSMSANALVRQRPSQSSAADGADDAPSKRKSVIETQLGVAPLRAEATSAAAAAAPRSTQQPHKKPPLKGVVEHLLECDAAYMTQIRGVREQLGALECEKSRLDAEVTQLRRRLRGVNAVQENDVAVAHCSAIMQHRLSKAEEEFMKLLTAQAEVRKDVDRVRREIVSLKTVRRKLEVDIEDVRHANAAMQDKTRALKTTRNVLFGELVDLEKKAELAAEEQRLNLPPEEAVVVDVEKLMSAVQERNASRRVPHHSSAWTPGAVLALQTPSPAPGGGGGSGSSASDPSASKPRLSYQSAFQLIQTSLGCSELTSFIDGFVEVEDQLLSKYKATLALEEEAAALQKELQRLAKDAAARHASIRGSHQVSTTLHDEMQAKIRTLVARMKAYNELREVRNHENARLRSIMQRCLEVLQAETLLSSQESIGGPMLMSELPSPALLEALQKKMTEVAMVMKIRHRAKIIEGPKNCFQAGRDVGARRSNMFSTRESRIVLGPREPAGSALAAILGTAQAPSVEAALALTERNSLETNHSVVCLADAAGTRRSTSGRSLKSVAHGRARGGAATASVGGFEDIDNDSGPSSHPTIENTRRRSSRLPAAFPVVVRRHDGEREDEEGDEDR